MSEAFVDPRGTRFGGFLTGTAAVAAALAGASWLAAIFAAILLAGALFGRRFNLWGQAYRLLVRPLLKPPQHREPEAPPRFAQLVGGAFFAAAAVAQLAGGPVVAWLLLGVVGALAYANAFFGFCLGCRIYGLLARRTPVSVLVGVR